MRTSAVRCNLTHCSAMCRFVAMRCAGFDRVDVASCQRLGITVARVPTYSPASVAEHAIAMLLCLNRCANQDLSM